jgi:hypothetical protein
MQSITRHLDPALSEDNLADLGSQLDLPGGWGFRAEILDQDLEVSSNPDNLAHLLQDNLHNVYQGSDAGRAFSRFVEKTRSGRDACGAGVGQRILAEGVRPPRFGWAAGRRIRHREGPGQNGSYLCTREGAPHRCCWVTCASTWPSRG